MFLYLIFLKKRHCLYIYKYFFFASTLLAIDVQKIKIILSGLLWISFGGCSGWFRVVRRLLLVAFLMVVGGYFGCERWCFFFGLLLVYLWLLWVPFFAIMGAFWEAVNGGFRDEMCLLLTLLIVLEMQTWLGILHKWLNPRLASFYRRCHVWPIMQ
jgi:hypothetical protein